MTDAKKLLRKKNLSGRELGIIEVENMALDYRFRSNQPGKKGKGAIISQEDLGERLKKLTDEEELNIYDGYIKVHEWIMKNYNIAQGIEQQLRLCVEKIGGFLESASLSENVYTYISRLPMIVTEKQYNETRKKSKNKLLEERSENIFSLILSGIEYYLKHDSTNEIEKILEKYKTEQIKSLLVLNHYNRQIKNGYYELEDGQRSDKMSRKDWCKAICKAPELVRMVTRIILHDKEVSLDPKELTAQLESDVIRAWFNMYVANIDYRYQKGDIHTATFHPYQDPPEGGLTKYNFALRLDDYFEDIDEETPEPVYIEEAKALRAELDELITAICDLLEKKGVLVNGKNLLTVPVEKWRDYTFSWRELYKKDVFYIRQYVESDGAAFGSEPRARRNGIAVVTNCLHSHIRTDKKGNYAPPEAASIFNNVLSLEAFFPENKNFANNLRNLNAYYSILEQSVYYIRGYNYAIDIISEQYSLPSINIFKRDISFLDKSVKGYNVMIKALHDLILATHYDDTLLQAQKLTVLEDVFREELNFEGIEPSEKRKDFAKKLLAEFIAFKDPQAQNMFMDLLTTDIKVEFVEG